MITFGQLALVHFYQTEFITHIFPNAKDMFGTKTDTGMIFKLLQFTFKLELHRFKQQESL